MKVALLLFLVCAATVPARAQKRGAKEWGVVAAYLKNLPEKYIMASGDFAPRSKDTAVIDEKNGYAAYLRSNT